MREPCGNCRRKRTLCDRCSGCSECCTCTYWPAGDTADQQGYFQYLRWLVGTHRAIRSENARTADGRRVVYEGA